MKYITLYLVFFSLVSCNIKFKHKISSIDTVSNKQNTVIQNDKIIENKTVISNKTVEYDPRTDPAIKSDQDVTYRDNQYKLYTYGWYHGDILYSHEISGSFEYIKSHKLSEKELSDKVIYSKEVQKLKELK